MIFKFITKFKLAGKDKVIIKSLRESDWYNENKGKDKNELHLSEINRNEIWVQKVEDFIDTAISKKWYQNPLKRSEAHRHDLIDIFLLMIIATMPNPVFKTGKSDKTVTLVSASIYQELDKYYKVLLKTLGINYSEHDHKNFGHKFASDAMIFALRIKKAHDREYGRLHIEDAPV